MTDRQKINAASRTVSVAQQREQQRAVQEAIAGVSLAPSIPKDSPPPDGMGTEAANYWRLFVSSAPEGSLLEIDRPILRHYCQVLSRLDKVMDRLEEEDIVSYDDEKLVKNPYFAVLNTLTSMSATLAARLRLQPSVRTMNAREKAAQGLGKGPPALSKPSARVHLLFNGGRAVPADGNGFDHGGFDDDD